MFAVVKAGGKQYRVTEGMTLKVEKMTADPGSTVQLDKVLMVSKDGQVTLGSPYVNGTRVEVTVVGHGKNKKISILKFKRRKHHMKRAGHRQQYTQIKVDKIG